MLYNWNINNWGLINNKINKKRFNKTFYKKSAILSLYNVNIIYNLCIKYTNVYLNNYTYNKLTSIRIISYIFFFKKLQNLTLKQKKKH